MILLQQKVNPDYNTNKKQVYYKHANSNTLKPSTTSIMIKDIFSVSSKMRIFLQNLWRHCDCDRKKTLDHQLMSQFERWKIHSFWRLRRNSKAEFNLERIQVAQALLRAWGIVVILENHLFGVKNKQINYTLCHIFNLILRYWWWR